MTIPESVRIAGFDYEVSIVEGNGFRHKKPGHTKHTGWDDHAIRVCAQREMMYAA